MSIEEKEELSISIFPNPALNQLNISASNISNGTYSIYDLTGRLLAQSQISGISNTIDISNLRSGQYILSISDEGDLKSEQKFSKL